MEIYEFDYGWSRLRARIWGKGSVYVDMPSRIGYTDRICLEERGWRYTSTQDDCIDYIFHMWMKDDGMMAWANDMSRGIQYLSEPFNSNYPNAGLLNDIAMKLYTVSHTIREYQKRNLPVQEVFELRKLYLTTALKTLGYDSIDAVGEPLDDSRGYLGLNRVVDSLEKYLDLSSLVHSLGKYGDYDQYTCRATKEATREQILEYAKPVKLQIDELLAFMQGKETELAEKRVILPEYRRNMKEKIGEYSFDDYEEKVKAVAILLLQLNADMLTDEQRAKFGIEAFKVVDELEVKDKISSLIDSDEFNLACRIEDEFAYDESEELVNVIKALEPVNEKFVEVYTREDIVRLLGSELEEFEERKQSVDVQDKIHKKYYTKNRSKQSGKSKEDDDDIVY